MHISISTKKDFDLFEIYTYLGKPQQISKPATKAFFIDSK